MFLFEKPAHVQVHVWLSGKKFEAKREISACFVTVKQLCAHTQRHTLELGLNSLF